MELYDGSSGVDWFYDGSMTRDEMLDDPKYACLFSAPCVLYDDGFGRVYRHETLEAACARVGVEYGGDACGAFGRLVEAMSTPSRTEAAIAQLDANHSALAQAVEDGEAALAGTDADLLQAVGELGVAQASMQQTSLELLQAVGELGAMVAAIGAPADGE